MDFFRILEAVRSVTGARQHNSFPAQAPTVKTIRLGSNPERVIMVHDSRLAKSVLDSSRYCQFHFLEKILAVAKPERINWVQRFCDTGLIMVEGPVHQQRRVNTKRSLDRCFHRLNAIPPSTIANVIAKACRGTGPLTARKISSDVVFFMFSECICELARADKTDLPKEFILAADFFNPFPTLSSLYRCNEAIRLCCESFDFEALEEGDQTTVLSLLVMGVSPMHAMFTSMINTSIEAARAGLQPQEALDSIAAMDAYTITATNFVMRKCIEQDVVGGEEVNPGDVLYLFLGSASGCPLSRLTSIPFGAGRHYCSGAKLTAEMVRLVAAAVQTNLTALASVLPSTVEAGRATAFLTYEDV